MDATSTSDRVRRVLACGVSTYRWQLSHCSQQPREAVGAEAQLGSVPELPSPHPLASVAPHQNPEEQEPSLILSHSRCPSSSAASSAPSPHPLSCLDFCAVTVNRAVWGELITNSRRLIKAVAKGHVGREV